MNYVSVPAPRTVMASPFFDTLCNYEVMCLQYLVHSVDSLVGDCRDRYHVVMNPNPLTSLLTVVRSIRKRKPKKSCRPTSTTPL